MQLSMTTDYAVRLLVCLAKRRGLVNGSEIAESTKVKIGYTSKLLNRLRQGGYVVSYAGAKGGFALAIPPEDISLLEVIRLMEPTIKINKCLEEGAHCNRGEPEYCEVHKCYSVIQDKMEDFFGAITIDNLVTGLDDNELVTLVTRDVKNSETNKVMQS